MFGKAVVLLCAGFFASLGYCFEIEYIDPYAPYYDDLKPKTFAPLESLLQRATFLVAAGDLSFVPFRDAFSQVMGVAAIRGEGEGIEGVVEFTPDPIRKVLIIQGSITGLREGKYLVLIREYGDATNAPSSFGCNYNPNKYVPIDSDDTKKFIGDLGYIDVDQSGVANFTILDRTARLIGPYPIAGRAIVLQSYDSSYGNDNSNYASYGKSYGKGYDSSDGKGHGQGHGNSYDSSDGKGHGKSYDSSDGKGHGKSYDSSDGKGHGKSYDSSDGKSYNSYDSSDGKGYNSYDSSDGKGYNSYDSSDGKGYNSYDSSDGKGYDKSNSVYYGKGHGKGYSSGYDSSDGKDYGKSYDKSNSVYYGKDYGKRFVKDYFSSYGKGYDKGKAYDEVHGKLPYHRSSHGDGSDKSYHHADDSYKKPGAIVAWGVIGFQQ